MQERIQSILVEKCGVLPGQEIVVGVSGGPDSMCLLHLLHKSNYLLVVACLDHGLRPEAVDEVALVRQAAEDLGAVFVTESVNASEFAARHSLSTEAAARQLRYDFLFKIAHEMNAAAVLVGHNADDQAETIFLHLLRGTGLAGLRGMEFRSYLERWSTEIPLVRPLLTSWRREVIEYCLHNNMQTVQDATNQSVDYLRNRLRIEILPYLEQFQPRIRQHLVRLAGTLSVDFALIQDQVDAAWNDCVGIQGVGFTGFKRKAFLQQPVGIQRYLIRRAMLSHRTELQDIEYSMIERACTCLPRSSGSTAYDLGAGLYLLVEPELAWIASRAVNLPTSEWPTIDVGQPLELPVPGILELKDGWTLTSEVEDINHRAEFADQDPSQAWFDADVISQPLIARARIPGDRIKPLGMAGKSMKISDLMINLKLPVRSRVTWPIVCAGAEIIWVPGCRASGVAQLGQKTRRVLHLKLEQRTTADEKG